MFVESAMGEYGTENLHHQIKTGNLNILLSFLFPLIKFYLDLIVEISYRYISNYKWILFHWLLDYVMVKV